MTIPDHVPDEWVAEATRKRPSEPRRRPLHPVGVVTWWVGVPVIVVSFWAVVVWLIWFAA